MGDIEQVRDVFMMLLIGGNQIKEEQLLTMLAELCDLSGLSDDNDFENVGVNYTTMFVEKSFKMIMEEEYDMFINYFKGELIKMYNFELVIYLSL